MTATTTTPAEAGSHNAGRADSPGGRTRDPKDAGSKAFNRLAATCLTLFALIWLVPFLWALITSLRPDSEITTHPTRPWSNNWNLDAYSSSLTGHPIGWWYLNSFIISTISVVFTVIVCSMVGFVLQRRPGKLASSVNLFVLSGLIIPPAIVPTIFVLQHLHLFKTLSGLILVEVAFGMPFSILLFRAFVGESLPGKSWWSEAQEAKIGLFRGRAGEAVKGAFAAEKLLWIGR